MATKQSTWIYIALFQTILCGALIATQTGFFAPKKDPGIRTEDVVKARRFILVDSKGRQRGVWGMDGPNDDFVYWGLMDKEDNAYFTIFSHMDEGGLTGMKIGISAADEVLPLVQIVANRKTASIQGMDKAPPGTTTHSPKFTLAIQKGTPVLILSNPEKSPRLKLSAEESEAKLELMDKSGKTTYVFPDAKEP